MRLRGVFVAAVSVLALAACAEMDQPAPTFGNQVSAVTTDESGVSFLVTVSFDDTLTVAEATILLDNVIVSHDSGIEVFNPDPLVDPNSIAPEDPHWNQADPGHGFEVTVTPEGDLSQRLDDRRWKWVEVDVAELVQHCPPGHGMGGPSR